MTIDVNEVNQHKYYGVATRSFGRCPISARDYEGDHLVVCGKGFTYQNGYGFQGSLRDVVAYHLRENSAVFEFDTFQELCRWLSE